MRQAFVIAVLFFVLVAVAGCEDKKEDKFSGLSGMVAERHDARKTIARENSQKKVRVAKPAAKESRDEDLGQDKLSGDMLSVDIIYDKEIVIVDSQSGMPLAKGVAYMNKNGQIVKIKIRK